MWILGHKGLNDKGRWEKKKMSADKISHFYSQAFDPHPKFSDLVLTNICLPW